jgi:hypothetical protein
MSKIFTGNVFISTSRQAIEKVFFSKNRLSNFNDRIISLSEEELKRSLLVTPNKNSNLISLDYSFGAPGAPDSNLLKLKFVETDSLFEFFYINKSVGSTLLTKLIQELEQNDLREKKTVTGKYNRSNVYGNLLTADADVVLNDGRIFFAFGIGNNTKEWAGPFVAELYSSELAESADGIREITLNYTTTSPYFLSNLINTRTSDGLETAINKYKRVLSNRRNITAKAEVEAKRGDIELNMHSIVIQLIKKYISVCTNNSESIVLLPNIDYAYFRSKGEVGYLANKVKREKLAVSRTFETGLGKEAKDADFKKSLTNVVAKELEMAFQEFFNKLTISVENKVSTTTKLNVPLLPEFSQEYPDPTDNKNLILSISSKLETKSEEDRLVDFFHPLYTISEFFTQTYPSLTGIQSATDIEYYEECDIRILKLWKSYGFITNDTRPVIVFGSNKIIQHLLYLAGVLDIGSLFEETNNVEAIHPEDETLYYNKGYRYEYFSEFIKNQTNSSFGENTLTTDGLELKEFDPEFLRFAGIPVFRFNISNSNVLGLSVDYQKAYTSVYNLALRQKSLLPLINTSLDYIREKIEEDLSVNKDTKTILNIMKTEAEISIFSNGRMPNAYTDLLALVGKWYRSNLNYYGPGSVRGEKLKNFTEETLIQYLALVLTSNFKLGDSLAKPFLEINGSSDAYLQNVILKQLESVALQVRVKTLPFFKLSSMGSLNGKRVLLLGASNTIIGSGNKKRLMPYSGLYVISEFRHVVSSEDIYSEFTLSKLLGDSTEATTADSNGTKDLSKTAKDLEAKL